MTTAGELQAALTAALARATSSPVDLKGLVMLPGGASQEMWRLDLTILSGPWQGEYQLVMRRHLGTKIYEDALEPESEFKVLQAAFNSDVPVPRPYWFLDDVLGHPGLVMQRLEGETIGRRIVKEPGLAQARQYLPRQLGSALATIHGVDIDRYVLRGLLPGPALGKTAARMCLDQIIRDLDHIGEPHPAVELGLRWLELHEPPPPARQVLVHGDFRIGNVVVNDRGLSGVLDWEFAHVGDPAEDLAWGLVRDWRFGADHLEYGGIGQPRDFFEAYQERTGCTVDLQRVMYWQVLGNVRWAVGTLNQAERHLRGGEPNLELASLGRRSAEMELEALRLIRRTGW